MGERLQKVLARHGLGSRREIEDWIRGGRILLNGQPAQLGDHYSPGDRVVLDGRDVTARLRSDAPAQVLLYNKPPGQTLTTAAGASTGGAVTHSVLGSLPERRGRRWLPINPMSPADSGLLLLCTDGVLVDALMRRSSSLPATYAVRVHVPEERVEPPTPGCEVLYEDERVVFDAVEPAGGEGSNLWFTVRSSRADRRAALRALFESQGLQVGRVIQLRYGNVELPRDLPRGRHRLLPAAACSELYALAGLAPPVEAPPKSAPNFRRQSTSRRVEAARARTRRRTRRFP